MSPLHYEIGTNENKGGTNTLSFWYEIFASKTLLLSISYDDFDLLEF